MHPIKNWKKTSFSYFLMYDSIFESFIYQAATLFKQEKNENRSVLKHSLFDIANRHNGSELGLGVRPALGSNSLSSLDRILCFCFIISTMAGRKECWSPQLCCLSLCWGAIGWKIKTLQKNPYKTGQREFPYQPLNFMQQNLGLLSY